MTKNNMPKHIAFIMDGNRRWARQRGLPVIKGHYQGYKRVLEIGKACLERGIKIMTVYAFSIENWNRSAKEVDYLMDLLRKVLTKELKRFDKAGVRLNFIGEKDRLPKDVLLAINRAVIKTKKNTRGILNIALNYGGRQEIVSAMKKLIKSAARAQDVSVEKINSLMYTAGLPDPDLIIRTSGEFRMSNFLLWQLAYSELYFAKCYWPDFSVKELDKALANYARRQRRYGK